MLIYKLIKLFYCERSRTECFFQFALRQITCVNTTLVLMELFILMMCRSTSASSILLKQTSDIDFDSAKGLQLRVRYCCLHADQY